MNHFNAEAIARSDARDAIDIARNSGSDPIAWLTGNSYMPALRDFGQAEAVWQAGTNDAELWGMYAETLEKALEDDDVYLGCLEYDNSLYVVDTRRFERREDADDAETLTDEWVGHVPYPHSPGYLFDCPACEASCHCTAGSTECVYEGEHNGTASTCDCEGRLHSIHCWWVVNHDDGRDQATGDPRIDGAY